MPIESVVYLYGVLLTLQVLTSEAFTSFINLQGDEKWQKCCNDALMECQNRDKDAEEDDDYDEDNLDDVCEGLYLFLQQHCQNLAAMKPQSEYDDRRYQIGDLEFFMTSHQDNEEEKMYICDIHRAPLRAKPKTVCFRHESKINNLAVPLGCMAEYVTTFDGCRCCS